MTTNSKASSTGNTAVKLSCLCIATPLCIALAGCDGNSQPFEEQAEVLTLDLVSVSVIGPPNIDVNTDIIINQNQQIELGVAGIDSSGSSVDLEPDDRRWISSDSSVISVSDNGTVTGLEDGSATVMVLISNIVSDEVSFLVQDSELVEITSIEGAENLERCIPSPYFAIGLFDDGTTRTLFDADFNLQQSSTAILDQANQSTIRVNANTAGALTLTARSADVEPSAIQITVLDTLDSISVSPNPLITDIDDTTNFVATGQYTSLDGLTTTNVDITNNIDWVVVESSSGEGRIVSIGGSNPGLFTAEEEGTVLVQAFCGLDIMDEGTVVTVTIDDDDER